MAVVARAPDDASRAWELLMRFVFAERTRLPALAAELELSPVQCHVLHVMHPDRPVPMGRLAETLSCDRSNVTGLIDRLESRRLVERRPAPGDRRVKVLALTPAGVRLRDALQKRLAAPPDPLARLSPRERRLLVRILERLVE